MKIFNLVFCILFVISAGLQYNDPDPFLWIAIYLFGAFISYSAIRKQFYPSLTLLGSILFSLYAIYLFFDKYGVLTWATKHDAENIAESMKATKPWIEETREFFGLVILITVLLTNFLSFRKSRMK